MPAGVIQPTVPYCRACGWDFIKSPNRDADAMCDSCGDDLTQSFGTAGDGPTDLVATPGSLEVVFTWVDNPLADSTEFRSTTDGPPFSPITTETSPHSVAGLEGEVISGQVRSVVSGFSGEWTAAEEATVLA